MPNNGMQPTCKESRASAPALYQIEIMQKAAILKCGLLFLLIAAFVGMLYFTSATASLRDTYQPGIERLHILLNPIYISIFVVVSVVVVRSGWLFGLAKTYFIVAFICCVVMGVFVSIYHGAAGGWVLPEDRTLSATIERSLSQPSFSGRSTARVAFNGLVVLLALGITLYVGRKRYNKAN